jgi:uncharacterized membrane protein YccC
MRVIARAAARRANGARGVVTRLVDAVLIGDPGLSRLIAGWRSLVSIAAGLAASYGAAALLGEPAVAGLAIGGLLGFITAIAVSDNSARGIATRCSASYVPFVLSLALSIALHPYRAATLSMMVVLLFVHFYANTFGPYGHDFGVVLFASFLSGMLLPLPSSALGSLAGIAALSLIAVTVARLACCRVRHGRLLAYAERAFLARARRVLAAATDVMEAAGGDLAEADGAGEQVPRAARRLHSEAHKLHRAALLADACLSQPGPSPRGLAAERRHRLIYDTEQAVQATGRVAEALARALAEQQADGRPAASMAALASRFAGLQANLKRLALAWDDDQHDEADAEAGAPFVSPVALLAGRLPGSTLLARRAVASGGLKGLWGRWRMTPHMRTAIQVAIAVAIATPLGDLIDAERFYWADIGALIILAGTNTSQDRIRKLGKRAAGTVAGGAIGIGLAHLLGTGHPLASCAVITVFLAAGVYALADYYGIWVTCLVIALCQVYEYSTALTDQLMAYRLAENMLGATVAVIVAIFVLPLSTRSVVQHGLNSYFNALAELVEHAGHALAGDQPGLKIRTDARVVDNVAYELDAVLDSALPLSRASRRLTDDLRMRLRDITYNARELGTTAAQASVPAGRAGQVLAVTDSVRTSIATLRDTVTGNGPDSHAAAWHRSSAAIDSLKRALEGGPLPRHALRHLGLIDDDLAGWADDLGLEVSGPSYRELAAGDGTTDGTADGAADSAADSAAGDGTGFPGRVPPAA